MTDHVTHFDDCGCKSSEYEKRIDALTAELAEAREIIAHIDTDDFASAWGCNKCPHRADVKSPKHECDFGDCRVNYISEARKEYRAENKRLRAALEDIANMRDIDQDDEHRLRHKAKQALEAGND